MNKIDELAQVAAIDLSSRSNPRPATPADYAGLFRQAL